MTSSGLLQQPEALVVGRCVRFASAKFSLAQTCCGCGGALAGLTLKHPSVS